MRHITPLLITLLVVSAPASADVDFTFNNVAPLYCAKDQRGLR